MNVKNSKAVDNQAEEEQLLFDVADATQFRHDLFDGTAVSTPEIDLLAVKAISKSNSKADALADEELEIEHGMMILNSHHKELAELEELDSGKISNKKMTIVMMILLGFVVFIVMMFIVLKLMKVET